MKLVPGNVAKLKNDELTTDSNVLGYPLVRVPAGSQVTIKSGPNPYVRLTKGTGEMFYKVAFDGKSVAISANNLRRA